MSATDVIMQNVQFLGDSIRFKDPDTAYGVTFAFSGTWDSNKVITFPNTSATIGSVSTITADNIDPGTSGQAVNIIANASTVTLYSSTENILITPHSGKELRLTQGVLNIVSNANVGGTLGVTGETTLASAIISDLTSGRVVLAGTSGAVQDSASLTFDGTTLTVDGAISASGTLSSNLLTVQNASDSASVQVAIFKSGDRATAVDNDEGYISLFNDNDLGTQVEFSRITWKALDVTNNSKDSQIEFDVSVADTLTTMFTVGNTGVTSAGNADIEGYAAVGNGSALSANTGLIIDYDATYTGVGEQLLVKGTVTGAANTNAYGARIQPESITVPTGTTALAASLYVKEPAITATGTLTSASTVYIADAPTEGTNNYALWIDSGASRLDGALKIYNSSDEEIYSIDTATSAIAHHSNIITEGYFRGTSLNADYDSNEVTTLREYGSVFVKASTSGKDFSTGNIFYQVRESIMDFGILARVNFAANTGLTGTNVITSTGIGTLFPNGTAIRFNGVTSSDSPPTGISEHTTYYTANEDDDTLKLYNSATNAIANTATGLVPITDNSGSLCDIYSADSHFYSIFDSSATGVSTSNNTINIGGTAYNLVSNGTRCIYRQHGATTAITGLTEGMSYFLNKGATNLVTLHTTVANAVSGSSQVNITTAGSGNSMLFFPVIRTSATDTVQTRGTFTTANFNIFGAGNAMNLAAANLGAGNGHVLLVQTGTIGVYYKGLANTGFSFGGKVEVVTGGYQ